MDPGKAFTLIELPAARRRAFTLIELLVVIAIIGLLMTLLLPALKGAVEMARIAACTSQLKNIGHGTHFYAQDNRDKVFLPAADPTRIAKRDGTGTRAGLGILYADKYVDNYMTFYCPTVHDGYRSWTKDSYWHPNPYESPRSNGQQSYRYLAAREMYLYGSSYLRSYDSEKVVGTRLERSDLVLVADAFEKYSGLLYKTNHSNTFDMITRRPPYGCGFLFADSHVKFAKTDNTDFLWEGPSTGWLNDVYIKNNRAIYTKP